MAFLADASRWGWRTALIYQWQVNRPFRFPVAQEDKIRACEYLKYGCVNSCRSGREPISLPTCDRIGEMCLMIAGADKSWPFLMTDRESAYKNLPPTPDSAWLCLITLRNP